MDAVIQATTILNGRWESSAYLKWIELITKVVQVPVFFAVVGKRGKRRPYTALRVASSFTEYFLQ